MFVQSKLQFQSVLDQVFPEYVGVFGELYSNVSLLTLLAYPTSKDILEAGEEILSVKIHELYKSRSQKWASNQASKLMKAANRNPFQQTLYQSHLISLEMLIGILLEYKKHYPSLKKR